MRHVHEALRRRESGNQWVERSTGRLSRARLLAASLALSAAAADGVASLLRDLIVWQRLHVHGSRRPGLQVINLSLPPDKARHYCRDGRVPMIRLGTQHCE